MVNVTTGSRCDWLPPSWQPDFWQLSPAYQPYSFMQSLLGAGASWPSLMQWQRVLAILPQAPQTASGQPIRFVGQPAGERLAYEQHIYACGEVPTRENNWHDFFNALVWLAFPHTKAAINQRHVLSLGESSMNGARRGSQRDALTLFDESGVVVLSSEPELLQALRQHEWKHVFWHRRQQLLQQARCVVFGHAILEKLVQPYVGLTAKAWLLPVTEEFFTLPDEAQRLQLDALLAAGVQSGELAHTGVLRPLPLLGWPGWAADNDSPDYYDNTAYFRPLTS